VGQRSASGWDGGGAPARSRLSQGTEIVLLRREHLGTETGPGVEKESLVVSPLRRSGTINGGKKELAN